MNPRGSQRKQLDAPLLIAFPTWPDLTKLVRYGLNASLVAIAGSANLSPAIFGLLTWTNTQGR